jgi:hypothetical protein
MAQETSDPDFQWSAQLDNLLANWCDQAKCFEYMHTESFSRFNKKTRQFTILITIITAVTGTSNIIAGNTSINGFQTSWIFGGLAVLTSLANILQDKLGYQQLAESHKLYCVQWGQIRRKIESELILPYNTRKDAQSFLKMIRGDIDQVSSNGTSKIPSDIRVACYEKFRTIPDFDIPDICGQVEHTQVYIIAQQQSQSAITEPLLPSKTV